MTLETPLPFTPGLVDLPGPPFVRVPGIANFRDIGGYAVTAAGSTRSVRRHFAFRSADTSYLPQAEGGAAALRDTAGVRVVFDLRSAEEISRGMMGPPLQLAGVERREAPVSKENMSPEMLAEHYKHFAFGGDEGFARAYIELLESGQKAFKQILTHVRDRPTTPFLYHCSAGKDRTGVVTLLLLGAAGVADDVIAREYALTEQGFAELRPMGEAIILRNPLLRGDRSAVLRMLGSPVGAMQETIALLRQRYGSVAQYIKSECGFTDDDLARIRENLTSPDEPILD